MRKFRGKEDEEELDFWHREQARRRKEAVKGAMRGREGRAGSNGEIGSLGEKSSGGC